jgi:hypothetical protein
MTNKVERAKQYIEKFEDVVIIVGYAGDFHKPARIVVITADETCTFQIGACSWFWGRLGKEERARYKAEILQDIAELKSYVEKLKEQRFICFLDTNSKRLFEFAMEELKENKIYECL